MEGYEYSPNCSCCSAISEKTGKNIRAEIDAEVMNTQSARDAKRIFELHGLKPPSLRSIQRHISNHSPYVRLGADAKELKAAVKKQIEEHVTAQEALQEIMDVGMQMIRDGDMPITERMFTTALKEANKNHQVSKFEQMAKELDEKLFNRKTVRDEIAEALDESNVIEGETVEDDFEEDEEE